ncbi:MAG: SRPBCC family protein [Caldilineaceae bacterium]|nr:SRPBCC family protein [Caldilineaceae bacterium]
MSGAYRQNVETEGRTRVPHGLQEHTYPPNRQIQSEGMDDLQRWVAGIGGAALLWYGLRQHSAARWPLAALGAGLVYQGASGNNLLDYVPVANEIPIVNQLTSNEPTQLRIRKSMTVNRPASELYNYWRNLENLPNFMTHVKSVQKLDEKRSHWVVNVVQGIEMEWDAEITEDRPNEMIAWQTLPDATLQNRGYVKFIPVSRGTEVSVSIEYDPPGAAIGQMAGRMVKFIAEQQIKKEIHNFKRIMETGEVITTEGQPSGRQDAEDQQERHSQRGFQQTSSQQTVWQ